MSQSTIEASEAANCPVAENCQATLSAEDERCSQFSVLSPLPLAENLCIDALRLQCQREVLDKPRSRYVAGSSYLELAFAVDEDSESYDAYDTAKRYIKDVVKDPATPIVHFVSARLLEIARPLFDKREERDDPDAADIEHAHIEFAKLLQWARSTDRFADDSRRFAVELTALLGCLGTREHNPNTFVYPGTFRESRNDDLAPFSHIFYAVRGSIADRGAVKIPLTINIRPKPRQDDRHIVRLSYQRLIQAASDRLYQDPDHFNMPEITRRMSKVLVDEVLGVGITHEDGLLLAAMNAEFSDILDAFNPPATTIKL